MKARRLGFSLIELLVVIGIIAILAAILFPMLTKAREKAKCATCLSNLKQVGNAMKLYGNDWDDRFPYFCNEWGVYPDLTDILKKYTKGMKVFACPSDIGEQAIGGNATPWWKLYHTSFNWPGTNYKGMWPHLAGLSQTNPKDPIEYNKVASYKWIWDLPLSRRPMIFDGRCWHFVTFAQTGSWDSVRGFINFVCIDGHTKTIEYQKLLDYLWGSSEPK
ncbi:MAG: prepilin-type N-terminal cleavage/methylation domain-containing protein [Armatimonadetes bacterium]|nr:prepilin-type N-terminal cleavage/methylation domain-containing protein [Armatimonadota bacterium]